MDQDEKKEEERILLEKRDLGNFEIFMKNLKEGIE